MGARWAAVTDPLANEIASMSYVNYNNGGTLITQGDRIPASALGVLSCTNTACTCTTRSEEHTSELQSLMRISYAVFCLKKTTKNKSHRVKTQTQTKTYSE